MVAKALARVTVSVIATCALTVRAITPTTAVAVLNAPEHASDLVSGITAQGTAQAEAGFPKATALATEAPPPTPIEDLGSRLEIVEGTDHLIGLPGFQIQTSLFGEIRYLVNDWLQVGASGALRIQGDGNGTTDAAAQLLFGPTFNIGTGSGLQNAFFVSPGIGPTLAGTIVNGGNSSLGVKVAAGLSIGKRFAVGKSLALAPAIGVIWQAGNGSALAIEPIALSFSF